jgi:hypothetical protein
MGLLVKFGACFFPKKLELRWLLSGGFFVVLVCLVFVVLLGLLPAAPWFVAVPAVLAFPCFVFGLLASPLCGAALTFFAAAKKVSKESGLTPPAFSESSLS